MSKRQKLEKTLIIAQESLIELQTNQIAEFELNVQELQDLNKIQENLITMQTDLITGLQETHEVQKRLIHLLEQEYEGHKKKLF
jgi:hypothetical protein